MKRKRCFVFDCDGTVYVGHIPITGTVNFIKDNWGKIDFQFLSNNTSKTPSIYVEKLNGLGIPVTLEHILTPITPLVRYLKRQGIKRAYTVGNRAFNACLAERMPELEITDKDPQAVILAYDTEITYEKIATAGLLLQDSKIEYLATHPDFVCPSPEGPLPDIGSFIKMFEAATGRLPEHVFGKPSPEVLEPVLARYAKEDICMVGDRLSTDKKLGENAGIDFILVLSGEAKESDLPGLERQPTLVMPDLSHLVFED